MPGVTAAAPLAPWEPTTREEAAADRRHFDEREYDTDPDED